MATTFTLNYSGQEINNKLAQVETLATDVTALSNNLSSNYYTKDEIESAAEIFLTKTANGVTYTQSSNGLTTTTNYGRVYLLPASSSSGDSSIFIGETSSSDMVYLLRNGIKYTGSQGANWVTLPYSNIATKTDTAQTYLAKEVSPWNYSQISDGFRIGRSYNNQSGGVINEFMELVTMQTGDTDATSVGLNTLPALVFSTDLITTDSGHSNLYAIFAQINALGIRFWHGVEGDYTVKYIPFDNIVSSTNLKTINNVSLIGTGNIEVAADVESITNAEIEALFNEATNHSGSGSN